MILRKPEYYKEFTCIASDCQDNCCEGGWQIGIDEETAEYYQNLPGAFGEELRAAISRTDEYCFKLKDGACPLLDENKLCRVYQELGVEHMGVVCDQFPRYSEYFGEVKETGIGLACEEAARIVLESDNFLCEEENLCEEVYEDSEFEPDLYEALVVLRDYLLEDLQEETHSLKHCVGALFVLANAAQAAINEDDTEGLQELSEALSTDVIDAWIEDLNLDAEDALADEDLTNLWLAFEDLEPLGELWNGLYESVLDFHEDEHDLKSYAELQAEWKRLLAYYIYRYFTSACYSHNVLGVAQFAVVNLLAIRDLMQIMDKGENPLELLKKILHLYSREVEYSKDNVELLMENFLFDEVFAPANLNALVRLIF